jgi:hypothetical protein
MHSRWISPDFFNDPDLLDLPPEARLLFVGLWCLADREGKLLDRPRRIKHQVLPYDAVDVDDLLWQLQAAGSIVRYRLEGHSLVQVTNFTDHQPIHNREAASKLPDFTIASIRERPTFADVEQPGTCPTGDVQVTDTDPAAVGHLRPMTVTASVTASAKEQGLKEPTPGNGAAVADVLEGEVVPPCDDGFDTFWRAYPNKQGKVLAQRKWRGLSTTDRAAATLVAQAMRLCVQQGYREVDLCPHGSTFLNQRRWDEWFDDESGELRAPPGYGPKGQSKVLAQEDSIQSAAAEVFGD